MAQLVDYGDVLLRLKRMLHSFHNIHTLLFRFIRIIVIRIIVIRIIVIRIIVIIFAFPF